MPAECQPDAFASYNEMSDSDSDDSDVGAESQVTIAFPQEFWTPGGCAAMAERLIRLEVCTSRRDPGGGPLTVAGVMPHLPSQGVPDDRTYAMPRPGPAGHAASIVQAAASGGVHCVPAFPWTLLASTAVPLYC